MTSNVKPVIAALFVLAIIFSGFYLNRLALEQTAALGDTVIMTEEAVERMDIELERMREFKNLRSRDLRRYKEMMMSTARSKKVVLETGISLQEEKRLLEKQLEIMSVYLNVDELSGKIYLMRGDHVIKDFPIMYKGLKNLGGISPKMPKVATITSKERFAQPERGKVEEINGVIKWTPPQMDSDKRSNAFGEYVIFTDSPLILHGPPLKPQMHDAYPHMCAGITLYSAKRLYDSTFVGTKIIFGAK